MSLHDNQVAIDKLVEKQITIDATNYKLFGPTSENFRLWDMYASAAIQGMLASGNGWSTNSLDHSELAKFSGLIADALLAERRKREAK